MEDSSISPGSSDSFSLEGLLAETDWVSKLARSLLPDEQAAEDLSQDVLTVALVRQPPLQGVRLRGWLRRVAWRKAVRGRDRDRAREQVEKRAARPEEESTCNASSRLHLQRLLIEAVEGVDEPYRTAIVLRYFEGLSTTALAERLALSPAASRKRVSRGLSVLRARLQNSLQGYDGQGNPCGSSSTWQACMLPLAFPKRFPFVPRTNWELAQPAALSLFTAGSVVPAVMTMMSIKVLTGAVALILAGLFFFGDESGEEVVPVGEAATVAKHEALHSESVDLKSAVDASAGLLTGRREVTPIKEDVRRPRLRVVTEEGSVPFGARAAWVKGTGDVQSIELDSFGSASLPPASLAVPSEARFFATAPGHAANSLFASEGTQELVLVLSPVAPIRGLLLEEGGLPIRPVPLRLESDCRDIGLPFQSKSQLGLEELEILPRSETFWTEADGSFVIDGSYSGWQGTLHLPSTHCLLDGRGEPRSEGQQFSVSMDDVAPIFHTTRLPSVRGRMVWEDDGAAFRGRFSVIMMERATSNQKIFQEHYPTDDEGFFEVGLEVTDSALRGPLAQRPKGLVHRHLSIRARKDGEGNRVLSSFEKLVELEGARFPLDLGEIRVPRADALAVRVIDEQGTPVHGASLFSSLGEARSDEQGHATLLAESGDEVVVLAAGFSEASFPVPDRTTDNPFVLRLVSGHSLRVLVPVISSVSDPVKVELSWERTPFEGANETLPIPTNLYKSFWKTHLQSGWSFNKDGLPGWVRFPVPADGVLVIPGLARGSRLTVALVDLLGQRLMENELRVPLEPGIHDVDLRSEVVKDRAWVRLRVVDSNGSPVSSGDVRFERTDGALAISRALSLRGEMELGPVALTPLNLVIKAEGCMEKRLDAYLPSSQEAFFSVALTEARSLQFSLRDDSDRKLIPHAVRLSDGAGWEYSMTEEQLRSGLVRSIPVRNLEAEIHLGTERWIEQVGSDQTELHRVLPTYGHLAVRLLTLPKVDDSGGRIVLHIRSIDTGSDLRLSRWLGENAVGPIELATPLQAGSYRLEIQLETKEKNFTDGEEAPTLATVLDVREVDISKGSQAIVKLNP